MSQNVNLQGVKLVCIMPSYDKADTIAKSIQSVLAQKANFAYKLIIVDDCSTDGSYDIAREFAAQNADKIILLKNERNLGLAHSTNGVIPLLKGVEYFCLLDPDDWYIYDKKFADAVEFLDSHKDFVCHFANIIFNQNGSESLYIDLDCKKEFVDYDWEDYKNGKGFFVQTSGGIFRNVYFYNGMHQKFFEFTHKEYSNFFTSDGFFVPWHIYAGKAHFVNHAQSVYNYNVQGEWSSLTELAQRLVSVKVRLAFSDFFEDERKYWLCDAKIYFDKAVSLFRHADKALQEKHRDSVLWCFEQIYLSDYPFFDEKKRHKTTAYKIRLCGIPFLTITGSNNNKKVKFFNKIELLKIQQI